jgi:hypothetical protein
MEPEDSSPCLQNDVMGQMNPISSLPPYLMKTIFTVIPSTPRSSEWYLPVGLTNQNFVRISCLSIRTVFFACLILLDFINLIRFRKEPAHM